jgi:hypothetical protein
VVSFCDINQGNITGPWSGVLNFNADPGFMAGDDMYHLSLTSPCKNAGAELLDISGTVYYAPLIDLDGEGRPDPQYNKFDVGVDERWEIPSAPVALDPDVIGPDYFIALWQPVALATGYRLDVAFDINFSQMVPGYENLDAGSNTEALVSGLEAMTYYYRVKAYNALFTGQNSNTIAVMGVGIEADAVQSSKFKVQSFPNPFRDKTTLEFYLPEAAEVSMKLYDLTGREIRSLVSGHYEKGEHTFLLQAGELHSGVYILRMIVNCQLSTVNLKLIVQ